MYTVCAKFWIGTIHRLPCANLEPELCAANAWITRVFIKALLDRIYVYTD